MSKKLIIASSLVATTLTGGAIAFGIVWSTNSKPEKFRDFTEQARKMHIGMDGFSFRTYLNLGEEKQKEIWITQNNVTSKYLLNESNSSTPLNLSIGLSAEEGSLATIAVRVTKRDGTFEKIMFQAKSQYPIADTSVGQTTIKKITPSYAFVESIDFTVPQITSGNDFSTTNSFGPAVPTSYGVNAKGSRMFADYKYKNHEHQAFGWATHENGKIIIDSFGNPVTLIPKKSFSSTTTDYVNSNKNDYLVEGKEYLGAIELEKNNQLLVDSGSGPNLTNKYILAAISDWNSKKGSGSVIQNKNILKFKSYEAAEEFKQMYPNIKYIGFVTLKNQWIQIPLYKSIYSNAWNLIGIKLESSNDSSWKDVIYGEQENNVKKPVLQRSSGLTTFESVEELNAWW